jgi:sugar transferase (PEP-CTERM/EpsH1 system associated)
MDILHIIYRLDVGGMENGLVNLVNRLDSDRFHHKILCLTEATEFRQRIERSDVEIIECHKPSGKHLPTYLKVYNEIRRIRPDIVHTRNLGAVDMAWAAWLAGTPARIHSEHGWTATDPLGQSRKYRFLRRICDPAISRYVAVSNDIGRWMTETLGIEHQKIETIPNGVDTCRFVPAAQAGNEIDPLTARKIVFGTLGRQEPIKALDVFINALRILVESRPSLRSQIRVVMAGDGPDHRRYVEMVRELGLEDTVEFPGIARDVPALLRQFDFFVQPSLNEGISNTVLEAMTSGLPVIATSVGGNPELIRNNKEGRLVKAGDVMELRDALEEYVTSRSLRQERGHAARNRAVSCFSLDAMTRKYADLYDGCVAGLRKVAA